MPRIARVRGAVALALRHKVVGQLDGVHPSLHVGPSLDFNDLRDYVPGDDVSDIDWRATARNGSPLVKRYVAERRSTLLVAVATGVELSALAAPAVLKRDVALDAAATLAVLATSFGDHAALLWCEESGIRAGRPTTRLVNLEHQLGQAEQASVDGAPEADLDRLLGTAARTLRRRGVVAVVANDVAVDAQLEARIRRLAAQHTLLWLTVPDADPTKAKGPLRDVSTGLPMPTWLQDERLSRQLRQADEDRAMARSKALLRLGVASADLTRPRGVVADVVSLVRGLKHVA